MKNIYNHEILQEARAITLIKFRLSLEAHRQLQLVKCLLGGFWKRMRTFSRTPTEFWNVGKETFVE